MSSAPDAGPERIQRHLLFRFWVLASIAIGSLAVLALVPFLNAGALLRSDAYEQAEVVSRLAGSFVQQELEGLRELTASYGPRAVGSLATVRGVADFGAPAVQDMLRDLYGAAPGLRSVTLTDAQGRTRASEPPSTGQLGHQPEVWDWYREQAPAFPDGVVSGLLRNDDAGVVTAVVLLRNRSEAGDEAEVVGVLAAHYDAGKALQRFVDDLQQRAGVAITVTDDAGRVVAAPEGMPRAPTSPAETGRRARAHAIVAHGDVVSGYVPVADVGWNVRADVSLQPVLAARNRLGSLVLAASLVVGGLVIGGLARLAAALRDQASAEADVRARERRRRAILDTASDAFLSVDDDGHVVDWNRQAEAVFGWPRDEAIGRPLEVLVTAPEHRAELRELLRSYLDGRREPWTGQREFTAADRSGRTFPVDVAIWLTAEPGEGGARLHAFVRDITERVHAQEELAAARDEAMEASQLKSRFLANMSHEIRTPLSGVIGMAHLLLDTDLSPEQREYGEAMVDAGEHLLSVIGDILDLSKLEAGKLTLEPTEFEPAGVVRRVARLLMVPAQARGLRLRVVVGDEVPQRVYGDMSRLQQILVNLCGNAVKFTERGSVTLHVERRDPGDEPMARLRFSVTDTGVGVSQPDLERLFQPFTQGDSPAVRAGGGTGLGLSIVRHLVAMFGGTLGADSRPGRGSTFWVELPFEVRQVPAVAPAFDGSGAPRDDGRVRRRGRVLIVEDNALNQRVADAMVRKLGYRTAVASGGRQALALLEQREFDAVLMDCQMPGLDGYETTRRLRRREQGRRTPVIAMTANVLRGERQRCLDAGMDDYATKPVRSGDLRRLLHHWIDGADEQEPEAAAPTPGPPETPGFDDRLLAELRGALAPSTVRDLVGQFHTTSRRLIDELRAAVAAGDLPTAQRAAHELKGMAASFGATDLAACCQRVEDEARAGRVVASRVDDVGAAAERAQRSLDDRLAGAAPA
ncbi:ATP-binding protein [Egicoccus sp. AB-alg2]|uniref:ATP-binding protein n=1 Tax=Egicoccus sp. AB-alg2 TaxID=3242693 RepID=UPI00359E8328